MDLWRFGRLQKLHLYKITSELFNIPTPKDDIDGSQVSRVLGRKRFGKNKNLLSKRHYYCRSYF